MGNRSYRETVTQNGQPNLKAFFTRQSKTIYDLLRTRKPKQFKSLQNEAVFLKTLSQTSAQKDTLNMPLLLSPLLYLVCFKHKF